MTFIAWSTAAGSPMPPHFELESKVEEEDKKIQDAFIKGVLDIEGVFGNNKLTKNGFTVNCNVTAGMDAKNFHLFMMDSIVKLCPDAAVLPCKRVLIIVDRGPGWTKDLSLLVKLKARGFYLHARVPNTMHVAQPTNQNYGLFQSMYRRNLETLVYFSRAQKDNVRQIDFLLLVFGKQTTCYEQVVLEPAHSKALSVANFTALEKNWNCTVYNAVCIR